LPNLSASWRENLPKLEKFLTPFFHYGLSLPKYLCKYRCYTSGQCYEVEVLLNFPSFGQFVYWGRILSLQLILHFEILPFCNRPTMFVLQVHSSQL
jgi:hypothetical protein